MRIKDSMNTHEVTTDIRYILFRSFLVIIIIGSFLISLIHIFNGRPIVNILTAFAIIILAIIWLLFSRNENKYKASRLTFSLFLSCIYIPFGYITSPGSMSGMPFIVFFVIFILALIAINKWEYIFSIIVIIEHVILLQTEKIYPEWYIAYDSVEQRINDLSFNYTIISIFIALTLFYVMVRYDRHNKILINLSNTDSLTLLYNKRFIDNFLETEYNRSIREDAILSVVFIDLNNFKNINDDLGHLHGDIVLKDIASIILKCTRGYDISARYGGDEYLIILPNTTKQEALQQTVRLDEEFESYSEKYVNQNFSVSFGIADSRDKTLLELLDLADKLLYNQKNNRKNI